MPSDRVGPGPVVLAVAAFYAAFSVGALALHGWDPLWFVWIGERYSVGDPHGRTGYDGQFIYYLARDGWAALPHLDNAAYRLQRILYPLLVRALTGGAPARIPWAMVAINAASILATTFLVTGWLIGQGVWRWWGLVYPLFVGTFMAYSRDLTEPLACALAAVGVLAWLGDRRAAALILFALGAIARETIALFPVGIALAELCRGRWSHAALLALAVAPALAWQFYLTATIGLPIAPAARLNIIPAAGMFTAMSLEPGRLSSLLFIGLPVIVLTPLAGRDLLRAPGNPIGWLVVLHCAMLLVSSAQTNLHLMACGRVAVPLVLALLFGFPHIAPARRAAIAVIAILPTFVWIAPVLWWAPWTAKL